MPKIHRLDPSLAGLIAAGEVIQHPAGAIKEMVENSLDAGTKSILVEIKQGGKKLIRVVDEGHGIARDQVDLAFERHATSKISSIEDLQRLTTHGFRGEALASLALVAHITLTTKTAQDEFGVLYQSKPGSLPFKTKAAAREGTSLEVQELLANTPARSKFLKSDAAETGRVTDLMLRLAMANPAVRFLYISNDKTVFQTLGSGSMRQASGEIWGKEYRDSLHEITAKNEQFTLQGLLGDNRLMNASRKQQFLYINQRPIEHRLLSQAIEHAYRTYIPSGRFPVYFLNLEIDPARIDVNVHPSKELVRIEAEKSFCEEVEKTVQDALRRISMTPPASAQRERNIFLGKDSIRPQKESDLFSVDFEKNVSFLGENQVAEKGVSFGTEKPAQGPSSDLKDPEASAPTQTTLPFAEERKLPGDEANLSLGANALLDSQDAPKHLPENKSASAPDSSQELDIASLQVKGVLFDTYVLAQNEQAAYLIDQHAAHERVLFEKYMALFLQESFHAQQLLTPLLVAVPLQLTEYSKVIPELLSLYGFESDWIDQKTLAVRSVPYLFNQDQSLRFVEALMESQMEPGQQPLAQISNQIASKACKAAIKAKDRTQPAELLQILKDLETCHDKYTCPHGRPILIKLTRYDIEKMFRRVI